VSQTKTNQDIHTKLVNKPITQCEICTTEQDGTTVRAPRTSAWFIQQCRDVLLPISVRRTDNHQAILEHSSSTISCYHVATELV